ncbi:hypothetical protein Q604_UNBC02931G0001, partial [human gut metagenome]
MVCVPPADYLPRTGVMSWSMIF